MNSVDQKTLETAFDAAFGAVQQAKLRGVRPHLIARDDLHPRQSAAKSGQKSAAMRKRLMHSDYKIPAERKDCCACCEFMAVRTRNPYCTLQAIFVHKMGMCSRHSPIK
jgi:hypothetical protein